MRRLIPTLVIILSLLASPHLADARIKTPKIKKHRESLITIYSDDGVLPLSSEKPLKVGFSAFKKDFILHLVRSYIVDEDTKTYVVDDEGWHEVPTINRSYMGTVEGDPNSIVRVTLINGSINGIFITEGTVYGVRARADFDPSDTSGAVIVYRLQDNPLPDFPDDELSTDAESYVAEEEVGIDAELATSVETATQEFAPEGVAVSLDRSANILVTNNGQLKRLNIGVIGDYAFVRDSHAGNTDAALADMEKSVNWADYVTRGGRPGAKGSVPVALRVSQRVVYATDALQNDDGIAPCPLTCRARKYCSAGPKINQPCNTNQNCETGYTCVGFESNSPGNRCSSNGDCTGTSVFCDQVPGNQNRCASADPNYALGGKICAADVDCGSGTCTGNSVGVQICNRGPDDGKICQNSKCSTYGNCCASPGTCGAGGSPFAQRAGNRAGYYRTSKHCTGGSNAGAICTTNSECSGGSCVSGLITTKSSGKVQLFSGCKLNAGFSVGRICSDTGYGSWSVTSGANQTAFQDADDFTHENGHSLGANHDGSGNIAQTCIDNDLVISRKVCGGGSRYYKMCEEHTECPGSLCSENNTMRCDNDATKACIDDSDCPGSTCDGPRNRLCVGGTNAGQVCNADPMYSDCPGGTCTGAPMNWGIYAMSGSGLLGGFSPCSRMDILSPSLVPNQGCLTPLQCGDVNKSGGSYCVGGSKANYACGTNSDCQGQVNGICTKVCAGGPTSGMACSSNSDCEASATCTYVMPISVVDAQATLLIASGGWPTGTSGILYDDLADVATISTGGGPDGSVTNADGTYLLYVALGTPGYPLPTTCGQADVW